jgi:hypothetical protein
VPLYVEELTKAILGSGVLADRGDAYVLRGSLAQLRYGLTPLRPSIRLSAGTACGHWRRRVTEMRRRHLLALLGGAVAWPRIA